MESIASRLKNFVQHKQLSTSAFTRVLGYKSCEKIARLFRSKGAKPSVDIVADIANHFPDLDVRWLLTGDGEMLYSQGNVQPRTEHAARRQEALNSLLLQSRLAEPEVEEMTV